MQLFDLATSLLPRAQRLGLGDPATGFVDHAELEVYCQGAVRYLANRYQLRHFLAMNRELLRTTVDIERYHLPAGYGFVAPQDDHHSGLAVTESDGTAPVNLEYKAPATYALLRTTTTGRPAWFTLAEGALWLMPVPDAVYVVQAIYRPVQDVDEIPEAYVEAVGAEALWRLAADAGKVSPALQDERVQTARSMVNNEKREAQRFFQSRERIGYGRGGRRGR